MIYGKNKIDHKSSYSKWVFKNSSNYCKNL